MDDAALLLRVILDNPEEDTPRLMYADCIQDTQPERAEFIRAAIWRPSAEFVNLTRSDPFPLLGMQPAGEIAVGGSGGDVQRTWMWGDTGEFGAMMWDCGRGLWYKTDRGFIHLVRGSSADFLTHAAAIFALHPVDSVRLLDVVSRVAGGTYFHFWTPFADCKPIVKELVKHLQNFDTEDAAHEALSAILVAYGRDEANRLRKELVHATTHH